MNAKTFLKKVLNFGIAINIFELEQLVNLMNDYCTVEKRNFIKHQ